MGQTFWSKWRDVILLCSIGTVLLVISCVFPQYKELSDHTGHIGTWVLAAGIAIWILRGTRR